MMTLFVWKLIPGIAVVIDGIKKVSKILLYLQHLMKTWVQQY